MQIELRNASKQFARIEALDSVSLEFGPGELVTILGLNGAGKSTLLRALSGAVGLTSGELLFDGKPFRYDDLDIRRSMLFIPDDPPLLYGETVFRNISIFLTQFHKTDEEGIGDKVIDLLEQFDIVDKADTKVEDLSRGQAYKTGLVILAAINPEVWILDEPFASGMDASGIRLFRQLCKQAVSDGRTVIFSTQLVNFAEDFASRVCVIKKGQLHLSLAPDELRNRAESDAFLSKLIGDS